MPNKITWEHRKAVYALAAARYGVHHQQDKVLEELGEFLDAYIKFRYKRTTREHFVEELADLTVVLEQLRLLYGVNDEVCAAMDAKVERLQKNLEAENA